MKKALSLAMLISFTPACFGSFALTRKLWTFNKGVSGDKFVQELVYLGLVILPVYELAALGDALIFNVIEFWGGRSPLARATDVDGKAVTMVRTETGLRLETERGAVDIAIGDQVVEVRDSAGALLGRIAAVDGIAIATGPDGRMRAVGNLGELWSATFAERGSMLANAR